MVDLIKYARLKCHECIYHGENPISYLTKEQYDEEMNKPNSTWQCQNCGTPGADFDDEYWEDNVEIT